MAGERQVQSGVIVKTTDISWRPSYRIIPAKYPPMQIFESIAEANDLPAVLQIEAMTDDVARQMVGNLNLMASEDRITGKGTGRIMPCFLILNLEPPGNRFSNDQFGAYYAGKELETALKETIFHRQRFLTETTQPAQEIDNILVLADIQGRLHDIRDMQHSQAELYDPTSYIQSQALAYKLKEQGSFGIVYNSVRNANGQCLAIWRPQIITNCRDSDIYTYVWDGKCIAGYYKKIGFKSLT